MPPRRPLVFVTRRLPGDALVTLARGAEVRLWPEDRPPSAEELAAGVSEAEGLVCMLTERVDAALLDRAPRLRVVSQVAVGVDNIDLGACTARGIPVGHTPGVLTDATADFTLALLLAAARRVVEADAYVRAGKWKAWDPGLLLGRSLAGATLGLWGLGAIGQAVARRARGFSMRLLYASRSAHPAVEAETGAQRVEPARLLAESDFLSLHVALTPETRHLVGEAELQQMKPGATLINVARGAVVDQAALARALAAGRPAFAALDVFDPEPLRPDDPLRSLPNVLLAPHLGSATTQTRERMAALAVENVLAGLEGRPLPHRANPPRALDAAPGR
jgi:glyoxylate reductase